jgi:hypothetical protein
LSVHPGESDASSKMLMHEAGAGGKHPEVLHVKDGLDSRILIASDVSPAYTDEHIHSNNKRKE